MSREEFVLCDNPSCSVATQCNDGLPDGWWTACFGPVDDEDESPLVECCSQPCLAEAVAKFDYVAWKREAAGE